MANDHRTAPASHCGACSDQHDHHHDHAPVNGDLVPAYGVAAE
ncbi:hypothetical protein [Azospirillum agricola]|nr:hypothetical protein [Azospirillum agricola]MBP2229308.1 hypothetical protein [Azospirillum agricola]